MCEAGLGDYPYNWECNGGMCDSDGCTDDDQCTFGGSLPDNECVQSDLGFGYCTNPCDDDDDCFIGACEDGLCIIEFEIATCEDDRDCDGELSCQPL
jgi:hypothetical protein